jgi:hypothetical protein
MATVYKDQYQSVQNDSVFVGRILAAAVQAAIAIYGELNTTPSHAARAAFAIKVMQSPSSYATQFAWATVADPTIDATATDATIFARINAQWNLLAGV